MARTDGQSATGQAPIRLSLLRETIAAARIFPNPWNVNEMDSEMFAKEKASISEFGFVDPLLVRPHPWERDCYQIIDGENRWLAGRELGMVEFPADVIEVDDEEAQELGIVLNETRGSPNPVKLQALVRSLSEKRDPERLARILPFSRERFEQMIGHEQKIDFEALKARSQSASQAASWVERVFRMPAESAAVIDDAIKRVMDAEGIEHDWRALELIAADSLAG